MAVHERRRRLDAAVGRLVVRSERRQARDLELRRSADVASPDNLNIPTSKFAALRVRMKKQRRADLGEGLLRDAGRSGLHEAKSVTIGPVRALPNTRTHFDLSRQRVDRYAPAAPSDSDSGRRRCQHRFDRAGGSRSA